ncbi:MAG TPA: fibronectin type III domain-containing protein [Mycobacteriales bacterium]|jgi:hypothetical protein|nr:fibronectin type III domain-containing protein [Mycobacteriales bacterium]
MIRRVVLTVFTTAAAIGLVLPTLNAAAAPASPARATIASTALPFCNAPAAAPCIGAVTRDDTLLSSGGTWDVSASMFVLDGATQIDWSVDKPGAGGSYATMGDAEAGHQWSITLELGNELLPWVTSTYADHVAVDREDNGDGTYYVTITGTVVTMGVNEECQPVTPETCPDQAGQDITAFQGNVSDFQQWSEQSQWSDFWGLDAWTNVEETSIPPQISGDPLQITAPLTNSRLLATGAVFHGFYHVILPNRFLEDMGIDDPSTLDPAGLATSLGDGAGTVAVTPGDISTEVDATGITFPVGTDPHFRGRIGTNSINAHQATKRRVLRVKRGTITPTRPSALKARRTTHRVHLSFHHSKARGSRITGYQARCVAAHHTTRKAAGKNSPLLDRRLAAGVHYRCQIRAKSKAGYGSWSKRRVGV